MSKYLGMGWWISLDGDKIRWDTIAAYEEPFVEQLPTDPEERKKRLEILGLSDDLTTAESKG